MRSAITVITTITTIIIITITVPVAPLGLRPCQLFVSRGRS